MITKWSHDGPTWNVMTVHTETPRKLEHLDGRFFHLQIFQICDESKRCPLKLLKYGRLMSFLSRDICLKLRISVYQNYEFHWVVFRQLRRNLKIDQSDRVITSVTGARSGTGGAALLGAPDPRCNEPNLCGGGGACR